MAERPTHDGSAQHLSWPTARRMAASGPSGPVKVRCAGRRRFRSRQLRSTGLGSGEHGGNGSRVMLSGACAARLCQRNAAGICAGRFGPAATRRACKRAVRETRQEQVLRRSLRDLRSGHPCPDAPIRRANRQAYSAMANPTGFQQGFAARQRQIHATIRHRPSRALDSRPQLGRNRNSCVCTTPGPCHASICGMCDAVT